VIKPESQKYAPAGSLFFANTPKEELPKDVQAKFDAQKWAQNDFEQDFGDFDIEAVKQSQNFKSPAKKAMSARKMIKNRPGAWTPPVKQATPQAKTEPDPEEESSPPAKKNKKAPKKKKTKDMVDEHGQRKIKDVGGKFKEKVEAAKKEKKTQKVREAVKKAEEEIAKMLLAAEEKSDDDSHFDLYDNKEEVNFSDSD
jgi:hypothetical protein